MRSQLSAKAWLALGAAVIAGTFVAVLLKSRGKTDEQLASEELANTDQWMAESARRRGMCDQSVAKAIEAARDFLVARYGDAGPDGIRELASHRCRSDGWPDDVLACLDKVTSDNELQRCIGRLDENPRRALEAEMRAFELRPAVSPDAGVDADDDVKNIDVDVDSDDPFGYVDAAVPQGGGDLPPECADYVTEMERIYACDKFPAASKDALKQGMDAMKSGWSGWGTMPDSARKAMGDACKQAADALKQAMTATGC